MRGVHYLQLEVPQVWGNKGPDILWLSKEDTMEAVGHLNDVALQTNPGPITGWLGEELTRRGYFSVDMYDKWGRSSDCV